MATKKHDVYDSRRRLRAIRRLSRSFPASNQVERLESIADIASGKAPPERSISPVSGDLAERLADGADSRSPRMKKPETVKETKRKKEQAKKRKESKGHDRQEGGGMNRTTDVNV
jgi:hypothetical protein